MELLVVNMLGEGKYLALTYKKFQDYRGNFINTLSDGVEVSEAEINENYVEFDSDSYHQTMKQKEEEVKKILDYEAYCAKMKNTQGEL